MAILLKELTVRYSPESGGYAQLVRDFYAMLAVWKSQGSGGAHISPTSHERTGIVDDVMDQVGTMLGNRTVENYGRDTRFTKELKRISHAVAMKDWEELKTALEPIFQESMGRSWFGDMKKLELNPKAKASLLSKSIQNFVKSTSQFPDVPKEPEAPKPTPAAPAPAPTAIAPKPEKPREKLPPMPTNLPPLEPYAKGSEPIRLANYEPVLKNFGYEWDDESKSYKNANRNFTIQISPKRKATVTAPSGATRTFPTLGHLLRALTHKKNKRHGKAGEPVAQVTKENFVQLYEFLYA